MRLLLCFDFFVVPQGREHDNSTDIWSLGVLAYEFLVGVPPFEAEGHSATYRRISRVDLRWPSHVVSARQQQQNYVVKCVATIAI